MTLTPLYVLMGGYFALIAIRALRDVARPRRMARAAFFGILALMLLLGDWMPAAVAGVLVLVLAVIAGFGLPHHAAVVSPAPNASINRGYSLLLPVLTIPLITIVLTLSLPLLQIDGAPAFDKASAALYGLASACVLALALALRMTREAPAMALGRGGELLEAVGWAFVLPLLLAVLGTLFAKAGVGTALAEVIGAILPLDVPWVAVLAYGLGMALLTMAMGNAFAAFPVIAGGIGMPFLVDLHGANPAPMALLDLRDRNAVIRAQIPTALPLLAGNLCLLLWLCFR